LPDVDIDAALGEFPLAKLAPEHAPVIHERLGLDQINPGNFLLDEFHGQPYLTKPFLSWPRQ
jgi:hypothetical protein